MRKREVLADLRESLDRLADAESCVSIPEDEFGEDFDYGLVHSAISYIDNAKWAVEKVIGEVEK